MYTCPQPNEWHRVHGELVRVHVARGSKGPKPPVPLILNGWVFSSAREKHERWARTIEWARANGCEELVNSIPESGFKVWEADEPAWAPEVDDSDSDESAS